MFYLFSDQAAAVLAADKELQEYLDNLQVHYESADNRLRQAKSELSRLEDEAGDYSDDNIWRLYKLADMEEKEARSELTKIEKLAKKHGIILE